MNSILESNKQRTDQNINENTPQLYYKSCVELYDRIINEYDDIQDVWYQHLSNTVEKILRKELRAILPGSKVLDVGCGTGVQTILYQNMGASVIGIDLNRNMIELANYKSEQAGYDAACFNGLIESIPFKDESFDVVSCCGDVINYAKDYNNAIDECFRVLRYPGYFVLESGNRISFDVIWELTDGILGGKLNYETSFGDFWKKIVNTDSKAKSRYPLPTQHGIEWTVVNFPTISEIRKRFLSNNALVTKIYGINTIMNLLPYIVLANPHAPLCIKELGKGITKIDGSLVDSRLIKNFASDLLIFGQKV
jgi:ubiquinone/menaquinone biosynthesis C-methylase UbiE